MPGGRDFSDGTCGETGMTTIQEHLTSAWKTAESDTVTTNPARRETEDETKEECLAHDLNSWNDLTRRFKLGVRSKLQSAKSLEGT